MFEEGDVESAFDRIMGSEGTDLSEILESAQEVLKLTDEQVAAVHQLIEEGVITLEDMADPEAFFEKVRTYVEGSVGN